MVVGVLAGYVVARRVLARRARSIAALTDRQREVLRAVAGGLSTKEIAALLGITEASVNTHIRRARAILGAPTRAAAAARVTGHVVVVPSRPRRRAASSNARTTSEMRSSNGTPISSAPFSVLSREAAHGGLHGEAVLPKALRLRVLAQKIPGFIARHRSPPARS